jgi:ATP-binding protein involved in chromosome partitioning
MAEQSMTGEADQRFLDSIAHPALPGRFLSLTARIERVGPDGYRLVLAHPIGEFCGQYEQPVRAALEQASGRTIALETVIRIPVFPKHGNQPVPEGVHNLLAVASAKGGVGKSTVAVNLALALSRLGARVGILDADIYGPSLPAMLGIDRGQPVGTDGQKLEPVIRHGLACMSIGLLVDTDQAMIWRGPMVTQALQQLLYQTHWPELDYLVIDLPPGTGDIQLTLSQRVPLSGALIVTTPQDISVLDARRGIRMFEKVRVPVLGIVENMATFRCPHCGGESTVFGTGGGRTLATECGVGNLGSLPLVPGLCERMDEGAPPVVSEPQSELAQRFVALAHEVGSLLAVSLAQTAATTPSILVEDA